jgi:hypothetical protein
MIEWFVGVGREVYLRGGEVGNGYSAVDAMRVSRERRLGSWGVLRSL